MPAHALAYDQETGFGLVQALGPLDLPALDLGDARRRPGSATRSCLPTAPASSVEADIVAKQEFAGYWEYLLDEAIFTAPAHPSWGGAALIGADGKLLGIGSLRLQMSRNGEVADINMVVPIDLLPPILDDLLTPRPGRQAAAALARRVLGREQRRGRGDERRRRRPGRPGGPARRATSSPTSRDGEVDGLADFYRKLWESGPAGAEVPMRIVRDGRETWLRVKSADRSSFLRKPQLQ